MKKPKDKDEDWGKLPDNAGQKIMEFLMTYGWVIMLVLAIIGAYLYFR